MDCDRAGVASAKRTRRRDKTARNIHILPSAGYADSPIWSNLAICGIRLTTAELVAEDSVWHSCKRAAIASERDQNFLLTGVSDEKFVLKISNALETRAFLEAQNSVLNLLAERVSFCQRVLPASSGESITDFEGHVVRLLNYLPGVPLAEIKPHTSGLLRDLGSKLGQLTSALADFDHPAVHRDFHWNLANGDRVIREYGPMIADDALRRLVLNYR